MTQDEMYLRAARGDDLAMAISTLLSLGLAHRTVAAFMRNEETRRTESELADSAIKLAVEIMHRTL